MLKAIFISILAILAFLFLIIHNLEKKMNASGGLSLFLFILDVMAMFLIAI